MLTVCRILGVSTNQEELTTLCGADKQGSTLAGLCNAAKAKGLDSVGMKIGLDELAAFKGPVVAHLWDNHFVVIESKDADTVLVTDAAGQPVAVKKDDLKKVYSGFALLVAKDASVFPTPKAEGPDLRVDSYMWDFGLVYEGDTTEHTFKWRNVGTTDLVISKVEASCADGLVTIGAPQTISAGGEGELKVLFYANQSRGVTKELYVSSNDPISPLVHLGVRPTISPASCSNGLASMFGSDSIVAALCLGAPAARYGPGRCHRSGRERQGRSLLTQTGTSLSLSCHRRCAVSE